MKNIQVFGLGLKYSHLHLDPTLERRVSEFIEITSVIRLVCVCVCFISIFSNVLCFSGPYNFPHIPEKIANVNYK